MRLLRFFKKKREVEAIGIKVGDIMTRDFIFVKPDANVNECAEEMVKKRVGSLIVKEDSKLLGIITEKDIIVAFVKKKVLEQISARDIMARKVTTISPDKDINEAMVLMKKRKFRWLPVVENKKIIGMLTLKDILKLEPSLFDIAREIWNIREEPEKLKRIREKAIKKSEEEPRWIKKGECEECGEYSELYEMDSRFLCEACKDIMK